MNLVGLTVCVNYGDHFAQSIGRWQGGLDALIVVTTPDDIVTQRLCSLHEVPFLTTSVFTARGAHFNKAGALNEGLNLLPWPDWLVLFDADIVPPADWRQTVEIAEPVSGNLYGAHRYQPDGPMEPDRRICGWFMMAHRDDPAASSPLLVEYNNASGYDTEFVQRWPSDKQIWIENLPLIHTGQPFTDWCGRGNAAGMRQLIDHRAARGGFEHERIK